jgi:hypothetical protein
MAAHLSTPSSVSQRLTEAVPKARQYLPSQKEETMIQLGYEK